MATGCVKIVKKSSEFDSTGKFIPKEKRSESVDLFKGSKISLLMRTLVSAVKVLCIYLCIY